MGIISSIKNKFSKKENLDLDTDLKENLPENPTFSEEPSYGGDRYMRGRDDIEIIKTKLDLVNARLENIDRRLANIERIAEESQ